MNKTNKRRGGFYFLNDRPYVSVTTVLEIIDKPALRWWFGQQVYLAMLKNPSLSQKEALSAPYRTSDKAKNRGTTVHSIVEAYKKGVFDIDKKVIADYSGYAKAFKKWVKETNAKVLDNERSVVSEKYKYAGTLDLLAVLNGNKIPTIVDIKTGKDIYPEAFLQLSAYKQALVENKGIDEACDISVLLLKEDGTYKYEVGHYDFEAFLACKKIWENKYRKTLLKIGYLKED